jgi:hypothetical protein
MPPPFYANSPVGRIGVRPDPTDGPDAIVGPRPRGSRRPHTDAKVTAVRRLIEDTPLTYGEIAKRTGVGRASICRWTNDGGWQRHAFAPRATDRVPRARASAQLKRRTLAARLDALALRHIRELEQSPTIDGEKLLEALELVKMAKLATRPWRRKRGGPEPRRPIMQLVMGDVDLHAVSREAIEDFLANRQAPPEVPGAPRRRPSWYDEHHTWMLKKERD